MASFSRRQQSLQTIFITLLMCIGSITFLVTAFMHNQFSRGYLPVQTLVLKRKSLGRGKNVPSKCNSTHDAVYVYNPDDDLLKWKIPKFNKTFKNPCWRDRDHTLHCLPYMYLVGMAKCATTDLFKRITLHPDFIAPADKEPGWLSSRRFYKSFNLEEYADIYFKRLADKLETSKRPSMLITGDASVNTLEGARYWAMFGNNINRSEPVENNPEYIRHIFPDTRILINVRDPVQRLWSEYLAFSKDEHKSAKKFHTIVVRQIQMYTECLATNTLRSCVYDWILAKTAFLKDEERDDFLRCGYSSQTDIVLLRRGIYHVFIRDFLKVFPEDQVLVQRLEDLKSNLKESLQRTYEFLGLRNLSDSQFNEIVSLDTRNQRRDSDTQVGDMLPKTRNMLYKFYKPHNKELAKLLKDKKYLYSYS